MKFFGKNKCFVCSKKYKQEELHTIVFRTEESESKTDLHICEECAILLEQMMNNHDEVVNVEFEKSLKRKKDENEV